MATYSGLGQSRQENAAGTTLFAVLAAISFSHLLNDMVQSLIPAIYPILKDSFHLSFAQIGLITLTYQMTASVLQPAVGLYTDRRHQPYSLAVGYGVSRLSDSCFSPSPGASPPSCLLPRPGGNGWAVFAPVLTVTRNRIGRETWARAVTVSGRRQRGVCDRTAACGVHCSSPWTAQHCLVYQRCIARHSGPDTRRTLVCRPRLRERSLEAGG